MAKESLKLKNGQATNLGRPVGLDDGVSVGLGHHPAWSDVSLGLVVDVLRVGLKIKTKIVNRDITN